MGDDTHSADLRNINEGDDVTITTTEGDSFRATCTSTERQHADERTGHIKQVDIWTFDTPGGEVAAAITEGLKSSESDVDYPIHSALWNTDEEVGMGYVEGVEIHGAMA